MIGAIKGGLLFQILALDDGKKAVGRVHEISGFEAAPTAELLYFGLGKAQGYLPGHMAGKSRQNGCHAQFALAGHDLLLQLFLLVDPSLRQRASKTVEIGHAVPRQVGGTAEIGTYLVVVHAHLTPDLLPYCLLPRQGQGHIYPIEGHPVDEPLPLLPLPPHHGVAIRAVVEKETDRHLALMGDLARHRGQHRGQLHRLTGIP